MIPIDPAGYQVSYRLSKSVDDKELAGLAEMGERRGQTGPPPKNDVSFFSFNQNTDTEAWVFGQYQMFGRWIVALTMVDLGEHWNRGTSSQLFSCLNFKGRTEGIMKPFSTNSLPVKMAIFC